MTRNESTTCRPRPTNSCIVRAVEPGHAAVFGLRPRHHRRPKRTAYALTNQNEATGRPERLALYTTTLNDGTLFYMIGVAPENEYGSYDSVFNNIAGRCSSRDKGCERAVRPAARTWFGDGALFHRRGGVVEGGLR